MNRMKVMLVALSVMGLAFSSQAVTVDGELSEDGTVLAVEVVSGEADFGTGHLSALTGNTVTRFVKTGGGTLVVPAAVDLSAYTGEIAVEGGVYRILASAGAGSSSAGDLKVSETAAFEIAPASGTIDLGTKHVLFAGEGPDGKGALRCAAASAQDGGRAFGTNLEMTGNAVIAVTTAYQLSFGTSSLSWQLDMGGHKLELRPYVNANGASDKNIRFLGSLTIVNPGEMTVAQGNLILRDLTNLATFGGDAANTLTMSSTKVGTGTANTKLEFSKAKAAFPWTLVWDTGRNLSVPSTSTTTTTNENCWAGPVELRKDMRVTFGSSGGYQRFTLGGPVSGDAAIRLETDAADSELNLLSDSNVFTGPLVSVGAAVRLWKSGALPLEGAGFVGTNATLVLEGDDVYSLPSATFDGPSAVRGGRGSWSGPVVKTGSETLTLATSVGGSELDIRGGKVLFSPVRDGRIAGLISGCRICGTTAAAEAAYESGEIVSNVVELTPLSAYDKNHAYWTKANSLVTYTGYLWNDGVEDVTWSFVVALGRKSKLIVNDEVVIEHEYFTDDEMTSRKTCGHANATIHPGANRFELRLYTSASSQGPRALSGSQWIGSDRGFVIDEQGRDWAEKPNSYNYYTKIADNGDATKISWVDPSETTVCFHPTSGVRIDLVPAFARIAFANGAELDCASVSSYAISDLDGFAQLLNCGTFGVSGVWTLDALSLTGTLTTAGKLDFAGAALALSNAESVKSGSFVVATAECGIVAQPTLPSELVGKGWKLSLENDGKSLRLTKNPSGLMLILR